MSSKIIEDRLKNYSPVSARDELNALKEITQEVVLCALARADFFSQAAFQGGSCLRIIHGLHRFSEDLDFILMQPNKNFVWEPFLKNLQEESTLYGLSLSVIDRSKANKNVKMAFLKEDSFGKVFVFTHPRGPANKQVIKIKLEVDTNPPGKSNFEKQFVTFPYSFAITAQDLSSLFASKCHALLCRPYTKGRDWFDFVWYISKNVIPNYGHLSEAINQAGPWKEKHITVTKDWLVTTLKEKIERIDWPSARRDAEIFLRPHESEGLKVWEKDFFLSLIERFDDQ